MWAEVNVGFNRNENGKAFEIVAVVRDISERKRAEEKLNESERHYRMIVENMHDGISLFDLNSKCIYTKRGSQ